MPVRLKYNSFALSLSLIAFSILTPQLSHASFDTYCTPTLTLGDQHYDRCSNLPILEPSNDNETNMHLLLLDMGLANVSALKRDEHLWSAEYGIVPFDYEEFKAAVSNKTANQRQKKISDKEEESYVYEERCQTNSAGTQQFNQQVSANTLLKPQEKQMLSKLRSDISPQCDGQVSFIKVDASWPPLVKQYVSYMNGSIAFYNGDYSTAQKIYQLLSAVDNPWLKETSNYMLVRTAINKAFNSAKDEYGDLDFKKVNQNNIAEVFLAINNYFKKHPTGQYAASTRGLMRRAFWMAGQQKNLINEFIWQFQHTTTNQYNLDIQKVPEEISRRIFDSSFFKIENLTDPFFLATYDLMYMRENESSKYKALTWNELQAQKPYFKSQPELYRYLQASHLFFIQKKPQQAMDYLPKETSSKISNYLQLSQQVLKGRILESLKQKEDAYTLWTSLLNASSNPYQYGMIEMALAINMQDRQDFASFFSKDSKIKQLNIKNIIIQNAANSTLLQKIIQSGDTSSDEKLVATYTLLNKSLNYQQYDLFVSSFALLPKNADSYKGYESSTEDLKQQPNLALFLWKGHTINPSLKCDSLIETAKFLEKNPQNKLAQLCIGEFVRLTDSGFDDNEPASANAKINPLSTLGTSVYPFKGEVFSRGNVYQDIIRSDVKGDLKAYALYRAINCYAPSAYNECGGKDVEKNVRKAWFQQLKQNHANTSWAKSLEYYW